MSQIFEKQEFSDDYFIHVGKKLKEAEKIQRPALTYWQDAMIRLKNNKMAFAALIMIVVYIIMSLLGPYMVDFDYRTTDPSVLNQRPSLEHWFGTDQLGRDLWTRVWRGARISLIIGFVATFINSLIGIAIGGISGHKGGIIDLVIMRLIDILNGIPQIILAILAMVILGPGITSLIIALILRGWLYTARIVRGEVLKIKQEEYVQAAKTLGVSNKKILLRHILPNLMGVIITSMTFEIPKAIFAEALLSYIGIGIQPPECSLGQLAKAGSQMFKVFPYQLVIPSIVISLLMLSFSLFGDGLRDALDPSLRGIYE